MHWFASRSDEGDDVTHKNEYVLIIIPTYNRDDLLPAAIQSALQQDYPFKKIVIIDDGSTDNTREVCRGFVDENPGIISYHFKENGGCASARNVGLNLINDKIRYVCFLDSDDLMLQGKLTREINILRNNPEASFCYSDNLLYIEEKGREILTRAASPGNPDSFAIKHFLTNEAKPGAICYRADALKQRRFDESFRFNEDSEFLQRIAIECKAAYSPHPGAWVRKHQGSKSQNLVEINRAVLHASNKIINLYPKFYQAYSSLIDKRIKRVERDLFVELMRNKRRDDASFYVSNPLRQLLIYSLLRPFYAFKTIARRIIKG